MEPVLSDEITRLKRVLGADPAKLAEVRQTVERLAESHPVDAWLRVEIGGIFDANGFEADACVWYEKGLAFGFDSFPPEDAPHFCVWYGSTLRNVGRLLDSERVLLMALERWPRFSALQFFLALTLMSTGRAMDAIVALAELQTQGWDDSIKKYAGAVESYLQEELRPAARNLNLGSARVIVRDVTQSAPWYEKVLGVAPSVVLDHFRLFRMGCGTLELVDGDEKNPFRDGGSISYWNVSPMDDWIKRFQGHGATLFRGPSTFEDEGLTICQLRDPFGTLIGLQGFAIGKPANSGAS
jgi:predicted enzyme related to lactoylglutathione lyase